MISKIFNYLSSGLFRTLGRFIAYILIGLVLAFLIKDFDFKFPNKSLLIVAKAPTYLSTNQGASYKFQVRGGCSSNSVDDMGTSINSSGYINPWTQFKPSNEWTCQKYTNIQRSYFRVYSKGDMTPNRNYYISFKQVINCDGMTCILTPIKNWKYELGAYDGSSWGDKATNVSCNTIKLDNNNEYLTTCTFNPKVDLEQIVVNTYFNEQIGYNGAGLVNVNYYTVSNGTLSYDTDVGGVVNQQTQVIINESDKIINNQKETQDFLTDDSQPNLDLIQNGNIVGWLPPGPVDSILNLPLSVLNGINNSLSGTCSNVTFNLPFVNKSLTIPCISSIFDSINGLNVAWSGITFVAGVLLLYNYFCFLYNYIDDVTSLKHLRYRMFGAKSDADNWGGFVE